MTLDRLQNPLFSAILAGLSVSAMATGAMAAKTEKAVRAAQVQTVLDCAAVTEPAKRLACYDGAVAAMAEAEVKGDLITIDREQRREVRRQAFGLTLPSFTLFDRGEKSEDADKLTATVEEASQSLRGAWLIRLEGGALWRQTDDIELTKTPHKGSIAVLKRGALGSFFMKIDGDNAFRAQRDR